MTTWTAITPGTVTWTLPTGGDAVWAAGSVGDATWAVLETHPYRIVTEDALYHLLTEAGDLLIIADADGAFWQSVSSGSATWSAA